MLCIKNNLTEEITAKCYPFVLYNTINKEVKQTRLASVVFIAANSVWQTGFFVLLAFRCLLLPIREFRKIFNHSVRLSFYRS